MSISEAAPERSLPSQYFSSLIGLVVANNNMHKIIAMDIKMPIFKAILAAILKFSNQTTNILRPSVACKFCELSSQLDVLLDQQSSHQCSVHSLCDLVCCVAMK